MRKLKLFSALLVVMFFFSNISIVPGSRHFIQLGVNKAWSESSAYNCNIMRLPGSVIAIVSSDEILISQNTEWRRNKVAKRHGYIDCPK